MRQIFFCVTALALFHGCTPTTQFYWGDYSSTLYAYKKTPDDKSLMEHKKSLNDIIMVSAKRKIPVPPGVYAELGFLLIKEDKVQDGMAYLEKEIQLYPESQEFITKIRSKLQTGGQQ